MATEELNKEEARIAHRYFSSFAKDYHGAFGAKGEQSFLHRVLNRLFRTSTFHKRTEVVKNILARHGIQGKQVLDLGCGSGEVSLEAAQMGARVVGLDIVEGMVEIAREQARRMGLSEMTEFRVADVVNEDIPHADVTMMVAVIEYYKDLDTIFKKIAASTRELFVVVDAGGKPWRKYTRYVLARLKKFRVYYHSPDDVSAVASSVGFEEIQRIPGHSYTVTVFKQTRSGDGR